MTNQMSASLSPNMVSPYQMLQGNPQSWALQASPMYGGMNPTTGMSNSYYDMSQWGLPGYTSPTTTMQQISPYAQSLIGQVPQPQSASQMTAAGMQADQNLPAYLQIGAGQNLVSPNTLSQFQNQYMQQYGAPAQAQLQSQLQQSGNTNSTFGGAQMGALQASNTFNSMQAGLQMQNQALQNWLGARQSYFSGEGQMAQNANQNATQTGLGKAQIASNMYTTMNNSANQYSLGAYQNMLQAQNQNTQAAQANTNAVNQNKMNAQQLQIQKQQLGGMQSPGAGGAYY